MNHSFDFENLKRVRWPFTEAESGDSIVRVTQRSPSTERTRGIKARFLETKMMLDPEFTIQYTRSWRRYDGEPLLVRRALAYKEGLEASRWTPRGLVTTRP